VADLLLAVEWKPRLLVWLVITLLDFIVLLLRRTLLSLLQPWKSVAYLNIPLLGALGCLLLDNPRMGFLLRFDGWRMWLLGLVSNFIDLIYSRWVISYNVLGLYIADTLACSIIAVKCRIMVNFQRTRALDYSCFVSHYLIPWKYLKVLSVICITGDGTIRLVVFPLRLCRLLKTNFFLRRNKLVLFQDILLSFLEGSENCGVGWMFGVALVLYAVEVAFLLLVSLDINLH